MAEERLLGPFRVSRLCYVVKPPSGQNKQPWRTADTFQKQHRAHVVAFPNVSVASVRDEMLRHPDLLAEDIQVVFLTLTSNKADIQALASQTPSIHVRGPVVLAWARHLCQVSYTEMSTCLGNAPAQTHN